MSSQLVDIDADGYHDILVGSFSGVPQLIRGSKDGFSKPEALVDAKNQTVLIADFWNDAESKWDKTDRAKSEGHCTSVSAVDWDDDGDLDLLLGDYYGGRLFLRANEGTDKHPSFATTNRAVEADRKPLVIEHGLAAPRVVDWDGDGLFDILCGGAKGGVYLFRNTGHKKSPNFAAPTQLIDPVDDPSRSYVTRVPVKDGQPTFPGSSYHIEPVDYDGDGDLDLLVGARCSWVVTPTRKLTDKETSRLKEIERDLGKMLEKLIALSDKAKSDEERQQLTTSKDYQECMQQYQALAEEKLSYNTGADESGDFVWLFRRR